MRDLVYCERLSTFNDHLDKGILPSLLKESLSKKGIGIGPSQESAFASSLGRVSNVFGEGRIDQNFYCAIEYVVFASNKCRIDFMLSGYDKEGVRNLVIIELKQWSFENVSLIRGSDNIQYLNALVSRNCVRETIHPSEQAMGYRRLFENFYSAVQNKPIRVHSCSYLHNFEDRQGNPLKDPRFEGLLAVSPTFLQTDAPKLRQFVQTYLSSPDNGEIFECLDQSEITPTKQLVDNVKSLILHNDSLALFDSQQVVFHAIMAKIKECIETRHKATFIINGGPGTGKSLVALKVLGNIYAQKLGKAFYLAQNSAVRYGFTKAIRQGNDAKGVDALLEYSGNWVRKDTIRKENEIECILVDEAHRLTTSAQGAAKGKVILDEIIRSALVSVFFLDEEQTITHNDVGTAESIAYYANKNHSEVIQTEEYLLDTQFRCNGSDGYIAFLDYVLFGKTPGNTSRLRFEFDLRFFEEGMPMYQEVLRHNNGEETSRVLAGYCYEWHKNSDPVVTPVGLPWNMDTQKWASRKDSIDECGCVYSAQGLEFDYVGVIIGLDLLFDPKSERPVVNVEGHAKSDHTYMAANFKRTKENLEKAEKYIKNAYKILLTRGIKGCFLYCEDPLLLQYLKAAWNQFKSQYSRR
ncbi:MAG: DNA/RNA helicase domain-containing protein [Candidatus Enteromonas sp.]|nr:DNA/RNA helicase domain-containing protein [Candidatus Enteromonas sp.]